MMMRLCHLSWFCSKKQIHVTVYMQQILNFSSAEKESDAVGVAYTDSTQLQPWKRVKKNNPLIKDILQLNASQDRVSVLADVMECDEAVIRELLSRDSCLVTSKGIIEKIKVLKSYGISSDDIVANPAILHRSLQLLKNRLQAVEKGTRWPDIISLHALIQPDSLFKKFIQKHTDDFEIMKDFTSREQFLAHLFQCEEKTISALVATNKLQLSVSPALISSKMDTFKKYKISPAFVRENSRVLFHTSVKELDRRLALLSEKQLLPLRPSEKLSYLLSCKRNEFLISFNYWSKRKEALEGCANTLEYICFRLHCTEPDATHFLSSSHMRRLSEIKLKQMLDFLLNEMQMKPGFVLKHKVLFNYSIKRLRERWSIVYNAGCNDVTIMPTIVVLTAKQFSNKFGSYIFVDTFNDPEE